MFIHHRQSDLVSCGVHALATALSPWYKVNTVRLAKELRLHKAIMPDGTLPWHMVQVANRYCVLCGVRQVETHKTGVFLNRRKDHWVAFVKEPSRYMVYNPAYGTPYERAADLKDAEYCFGFGLRGPRPVLCEIGTIHAAWRCLDFII